MTIKSKITKDEIKELPRAFFKKEIRVIDSPEKVQKAIEYLNEQTILGIDTETKPTFKKGQSHKVGLFQISTEEVCFLFRLNILGLIPELVKLLENKKIVKVGLSLKDDFMMLRKRVNFKAESYVELQNYVEKFGIEDKSLQKVYAILFNEKISKSQRLSNWEAETLSEAQQRYAATDAWACLKIYNFLNQTSF